EIMAGSGPDVFILSCVGSYSEFGMESALLNFPEKNMEAGLFLPLDEYMQNNTQFTDWSKQTKVILDAGRTKEGQAIIPLTYTFPVLVYPEIKVSVPYTDDLTLQEVLDDPETADIGAVMCSVVGKRSEEGGRRTYFSPFTNTLGQLADYESEKLLFTEEELYETVNTVFEVYEAVDANDLQYIKTDFGPYAIHEINLAYFDTEMALAPAYSKNGGVTASVTSFAAVNRSTKFPEAAFTVIDLLMQESMQLESDIYSCVLPHDNSIPMQHDLGQEAKPLRTENI
ncbi:MAG: extracellular solute-binding protein, partial [Clostridia bacterium]|nr:extracellular solute-binding protein [Clostridia bacterium]